MSVLRSTALLAALLAAAPALAQQEANPLFNGKDLSGFQPVSSAPGNWVVEDGILVTRGQGGGWLSTQRTFDNFTLSLEYRLQPGGNSGVFIRSPHEGDPAYTGMEIQILDDDAPQYRELQPFQYCGSVYGVMAARRGHTRPAGEWNTMTITARGDDITVELNGAEIVRGSLADHRDVADSHPGILRPAGYIGLQSHSEPVSFRNITIAPLP